jgi:hypothetical protein
MNDLERERRVVFIPFHSFQRVLESGKVLDHVNVNSSFRPPDLLIHPFKRPIPPRDRFSKRNKYNSSAERIQCINGAPMSCCWTRLNVYQVHTSHDLPVEITADS